MMHVIPKSLQALEFSTLYKWDIANSMNISYTQSFPMFLFIMQYLRLNGEGQKRNNVSVLRFHAYEVGYQEARL